MKNQNKYSRDQLGDSQDSLYVVSSFIKDNSTVLDVGCYQGALGKHLINEKNCTVDGIEYDPEAAAVASKEYRKVITADLNTDNVQEALERHYDYIIFADVLEHLVNPELALSNLKKLLKDDGEIVISVPNIGYQGVLAGLADGEFTYRNTGILDRTHLRFFTRKSLKTFIKSCGLHIDEIKNVVLPSSDSEFRQHFSSTTAQKQDNFLTYFPDTNVYQFVVLCKSANKAGVIKEDRSAGTVQLFKSILYWKMFDGEYSDASSFSQYCKYDSDAQTITFEINKDDKFEQLRFDPCEESVFCYIRSITIKSEYDEILSIQNMSDIRASNKDSKIFHFLNGETAICCKGSDPGITIDIKNNTEGLVDKNLKVVIEIGRVHPYSELDILLDELHKDYNRLVNSSSWKVTKPLRIVKEAIAKIIRKAKFTVKRLLQVNYKLVISLVIERIKEYGIKHTVKKALSKLKEQQKFTEQEKYAVYLKDEEIRFSRQISNILSNLEANDQPLISIVLPVYNSDKVFLTECLESVVSQSYHNWELCICDDASTEGHVSLLLEQYAHKDQRIKYVRSTKNGHISKASNEALELASGSHIVLLDHDDLLHKDALLYIANEIIKDPSVDLIYTDEDHVTSSGQRKMPFFKPNWSPVLLYSQNYIGHIVCLSKQIFDKVDGFTVGLEGAQDYDLLLKSSSYINSVVHIPRVLYHWREHELSTAMNADSKPYAHDAGKQALGNHLASKYPESFSHVDDGDNLFTYKPRFKVTTETKASIIIPIRDKVELLQQLLVSIDEKSSWINYEIIIVDNGSVEDRTASYLKELKKDCKYKVIRDDSDFNWSKVNNLGVSIASGDVYIFLNNDTLVVSDDWLESLLAWAQLPEVGLVGPRLLYEDGTLQHAGLVVGMGGWADHIFKAEEQAHKVGPFVSPVLNRNVLGVTGACQVIEKSKFMMLGGFDESFEICGSDVELCIRAHKNGLQNVYLADVTLYHLESKSRSSYVPENDFALSKIKYEPYRTEEVDPYFNPNLDIMSSTPTVKL